MDGIQSGLPAGEWYHFENKYGKWSWLRLETEVSSEPVDMDRMVKVESSPEKLEATWRQYYTADGLVFKARQTGNTAMIAARQEIDRQMDSAIGRFFDGTMSEQELSQTFQSLLSKFETACGVNGYPIPGLVIDGSREDQIRMDAFYGDFRKKILQTAVIRNNQEGAQYVTGEMDWSVRSYKYYNSDYYYKSEAAISAVTEGVMQCAAERGFEDYTPTDYKAKGLNAYYNFNSAWSSNFAVNEQFILDPDQAPPKNFQWFFETGGGVQKEGRVWLVGEEPEGPTAFDSKDSRTAATWAAYTDALGRLCKVSADIIFKGTAEDLYNAASLLQFSGGSGQADAANRFLQNLQLYSRGYFSLYHGRSGVDVRG